MAAAERLQFFFGSGYRIGCEVEGDLGQMQPVALEIEFDPHRHAAAEGDTGAGGFHLHAGVPPVVAIGASQTVFFLGVAQVGRDEPLASIPVAVAVADRAGLPAPGKPADVLHPASPPAVLVVDDGGSQVKAFLLPAGMQETVAVFSPGKARLGAL